MFLVARGRHSATQIRDCAGAEKDALILMLFCTKSHVFAGLALYGGLQVCDFGRFWWHSKVSNFLLKSPSKWTFAMGDFGVSDSDDSASADVEVVQKVHLTIFTAL